MHDFPNLFVIGLTQAANLISNITSNLVDSGRTIAAVVRHALDLGADEVEVTKDAEQAWVAMLESNPRAFLGSPDCTPGYYNNEGHEIGRKERLGASGYPLGPVAYFEYIDHWHGVRRVRGARVPDRGARDGLLARQPGQHLLLDEAERLPREVGGTAATEGMEREHATRAHLVDSLVGRDDAIRPDLVPQGVDREGVGPARGRRVAQPGRVRPGVVEQMRPEACPRPVDVLRHEHRRGRPAAGMTHNPGSRPRRRHSS